VAENNCIVWFSLGARAATGTRYYCPRSLFGFCYFSLGAWVPSGLSWWRRPTPHTEDQKQFRVALDFCLAESRACPYDITPQMLRGKRKKLVKRCLWAIPVARCSILVSSFDLVKPPSPGMLPSEYSVLSYNKSHPKTDGV